MTDEQVNAAAIAIFAQRYGINEDQWHPMTEAAKKPWREQAVAALAAAEAVAWQPIETAPKDGTLLDLWCVDDDLGNEPRRITNCSWGMVTNWLGHERFAWLGVKGRIVDWRPTHWRPLPEPPR